MTKDMLWTNIYFLFISYFLLFTSIPPLLLMLLCLCHMPLPNPMCPFPFLYPWSNLIYLLPFHYLFIAFPKVWSDLYPSIVPSHFSSFPYSYSILLSSLSHYHSTLLDPKGCTSLSSYSHYLYSVQPWPSSISRRPAYTIFLSSNLI